MTFFERKGELTSVKAVVGESALDTLDTKERALAEEQAKLQMVQKGIRDILETLKRVKAHIQALDDVLKTSKLHGEALLKRQQLQRDQEMNEQTLTKLKKAEASIENQISRLVGEVAMLRVESQATIH